MFSTLRYDFEKNHIWGDYLAVFELMEELRAIAHAYPQKKPGAEKLANGHVFCYNIVVPREVRLLQRPLYSYIKVGWTVGQGKYHLLKKNNQFHRFFG